MTKRYNGIVITDEGGIVTLKRVVADTYRELSEKSGIEYFERVHGRHSGDHDFVALVDEDGHSKRMPINRVGNKVVGYPGVLVGPVVIMSEGMTIEGLDFVPLSTRGEQWVKDALFIRDRSLPHVDGEEVRYSDLVSPELRDLTLHGITVDETPFQEMMERMSKMSLADLKAHAAKELAIMEAEEHARRDQNPETD